MNKATHIVLIDADFDKAFETANSINGQNFTSADEAIQEINTSLKVKANSLGVCIYELDNFRINVNGGSDILSDVFICFINIIE